VIPSSGEAHACAVASVEPALRGTFEGGLTRFFLTLTDGGTDDDALEELLLDELVLRELLLLELLEELLLDELLEELPLLELLPVEDPPVAASTRLLLDFFTPCVSEMLESLSLSLLDDELLELEGSSPLSLPLRASGHFSQERST
jgi:hypothetical protein